MTDPAVADLDCKSRFIRRFDERSQRVKRQELVQPRSDVEAFAVGIQTLRVAKRLARSGSKHGDIKEV